MTTTTTLNNKIVCFYHNNCTDGMMSAVIARIYHDKEDFAAVAVQYTKPGSIDKTPKLGDNVETLYILDFSFSPEKTIEMLFKSDGTRRKVIMLDHHKSAMESWFGESNSLFSHLNDNIDNDYEVTEDMRSYKNNFVNIGSFTCNRDEPHEFKCYINNDKSGALLTFDYFTTQYITQTESSDLGEETGDTLFGKTWTVLSTISNYVSDRDLWKFELDKTLACYELLNSWKQDVEVWLDNFYCYSVKKPISCLNDDLNKMQARVDMRDELATEYASKAKKMTILGNTGMIVNVPSNFSSIVSSKLYDQEGIEFVLCYVVGDTKYVPFSLRSSQKKDFDCEKIAKVMGGGGHKNSAGFLGDISLLTDFLNAIVKT